MTEQLITRTRYSWEELTAKGYDCVIGMDEVGRGALAGPLSAGAVLLRPDTKLPLGINDSKKLNETARSKILLDIIVNNIPHFTVHIPPDEVDALNPHHASLRAMRLAANSICENWKAEFDPKKTLFLLDGSFLHKNFPYSQEAIEGGDAIEPAIMIASCIAKVMRDSHMRELHEQFPQYGWDTNVGYSTKKHKEALKMLGPCIHHRKTYRPVYEATPGVVVMEV